MKEIKVEELNFNPFTTFGNEWFLLSAGKNEENYNTMTGSSAQIGCIWRQNNKQIPTCIVYARKQRYTKEFLDNNDYFSLSFFTESERKNLNYLGTVSGRDEDKVSKVGYKPDFINDTAYFANAKLVLICRKLYSDAIKKDKFIDKEIAPMIYPNDDFHDFYIGEIVKIMVSDDERN